MSIWSKVLVWLVLVFSLPLFYLGAKNLRLLTGAHESHKAHVAAVEKLRQENERLRRGDAAVRGVSLHSAEGRQLTFKPNALTDAQVTDGDRRSISFKALGPGQRGIDQLRAELHDLVVRQGRVWYDVNPSLGGLDGPSPPGEVTVTVANPTPHGITEKMLLYAFQQSPKQDGGRFVGEFLVTAVAETQVKLKATAPVPSVAGDEDAAGKAALEEYRKQYQLTGPWVLYELMPVDRYDVFAHLSEDELRALLPAASLPEYLKHGKPSDDPADQPRIVNGVYERPLHDYAAALRMAQVEIIQARDRRLIKQRQLQLVTSAITSIQGPGGQLEKQDAVIAELTAERDRVQKEVGVVEQVAAALDAEIAALRAEIDTLLEQRKATGGPTTAQAPAAPRPTALAAAAENR